MIRSITLVLCQFVCFWGSAQTITGNLSQLAKQEIKLEGFDNSPSLSNGDSWKNSDKKEYDLATPCQ